MNRKKRFDARKEKALTEIKAAKALITVNLAGDDSPEADEYAKGERSAIDLLGALTLESSLGFIQREKGRYEITPKEVLRKEARVRRPDRRMTFRAPLATRLAKDELWKPAVEAELLKVFPELAAEYAECKEVVEKASCTSCAKRSKATKLMRELALLGKDGRNLGDMRELLGDVVANALWPEVGTSPVLPESAGGAPETGARPACADCFRKHLAQAIILLNESLLGYPHHRWLAVGHLAEASEEILRSHPDVANDVREERLKVMDDAIYTPDLTPFFDRVEDS